MCKTAGRGRETRNSSPCLTGDRHNLSVAPHAAAMRVNVYFPTGFRLRTCRLGISISLSIFYFVFQYGFCLCRALVWEANTVICSATGCYQTQNLRGR
ncbi:hypothetical protein BDN72DRAFT_416468 [Pluteus cervinus]|uniref:Uncharacterized protein n=1 Tax=Pluteus cervinus TaxID=181527 RepID=A0ACD3B285_9AGAR|nr:hypothetical protein BDN72DRAFT_416468 [Pluteus cervinus]